MATSTMKDVVGKAMLINHLHRNIAVSRLWQPNTGTLTDIYNGDAVECVAIQALTTAVIDTNQLTSMGKGIKLATSAC